MNSILSEYEHILAESEHFVITNEYENTFLIIKANNRRILIGDFYGDPQTAVISNDEKFCAVGGCGLIIYYLNEPYCEFDKDFDSKQSKELFREKDNEWWIEKIEIEDNTRIRLLVENSCMNCSEEYFMNVYDYSITKCENSSSSSK